MPSNLLNRTFLANQRGVSIVEVLVVLGIALILVTASVSMFGRSNDVLHRQNAARSLKNFLERARFDSVKRRPSSPDQEARIELVSPTLFRYSIDLNQNGRLETSETIAVNTGALGSVRMVGDSFVFPVTIRFDRRGHISAVNSDGVEINPLVYFCSGSCTTTTANAQNSNIIYVSPTGTVAMLRGGDTIPTFEVPAISTVNSTTAVNPMLAEWRPSNSTGTPTPTPTPTPQASPTPTPTPTPTPNTGPTPTPTPSVPTCQSGQSVSAPCTCVSPMWVRSNGKCR